MLNFKKTNLNIVLTSSIAIICWSFSAVLITNINLPPIETLIITISIAAVILIIKITCEKNWQIINNNFKYMLKISSCITLNNLSYYQALKTTTADIVEIVSWMWPVAFILATKIIEKSKLNSTIILAMTLCSLSLLIIKPISFYYTNVHGITWSILTIISWCTYSIITKNNPQKAPELTPLSIIINLPILCLLHLYLEPTIIPSTQDCCKLILIAIGPISLAFYCWDYSIKHGPIIKISIASYFTMILSITWLVILRQIEFTPNLIIATILVLIANYLILRNNYISPE